MKIYNSNFYMDFINNYDQNLSKTLEESEDSLIKLSEHFNIEIRIVRPTLIYGSCGGFKDKNFSRITEFMRISPLLVLPRNSGYRQPISCYELANVFFTLLINSVKSVKFVKKTKNNSLEAPGTSGVSHTIYTIYTSILTRSKCYIYVRYEIF